MTKSERLSAITQILTENPNREFSLGYFSEIFDCAKSSISSDMKCIRSSFEQGEMGFLETITGSKGGVRYVPHISDRKRREILENLRTELMKPDRRLGRGFYYTTDIFFNPEYSKGIAKIFARKFENLPIDAVVTVETKGIGVAMLTAEQLNVPLVVVRREARITEGSTISINYFSGSSGRLQKMSLAKNSVKKGSKVIIIDDFMRGGGSIIGMIKMLEEFEAEVLCIGVVVSAGKKEKNIPSVISLINIDDETDEPVFEINSFLNEN